MHRRKAYGVIQTALAIHQRENSKALGVKEVEMSRKGKVPPSGKLGRQCCFVTYICRDLLYDAVLSEVTNSNVSRSVSLL